MDQIFGFIERITFRNLENGFTVAKLKEPKKTELTCIVGTLPIIQPGEKVRCVGEWKHSPTHGVQFEVKECHNEAPSDLIGLQKYLSSGLIRGIGPIYAERIIEVFGLKTLEILEHSPDALLKVPGLGEKRVERIKESWDAQKTIRDVMLFLQKYDVTPAYAQKIYKAYGSDAIAKMQENPFCLAQEIHGIGFKMADKIAKTMGITDDAAQRIDSGIEYVLSELASEGHVCYPIGEFLEKAKEILNVAPEQIQKRIEILVQGEKIVQKEEFLWSKGLYLCEIGIAREVKRLKAHLSKLRSIDTKRAVEWSEEKFQLAFAEKQKEAIEKALQDKIHIITGGPGTGKSTILKAILAITEQLTRKIILAAPTGRAAKRMSEITRRHASTIHSLLQYDFSLGKFRRNQEHPLLCDLIVIDESSMIDTWLMYHLLRAIPNEARVLFVGDVHQLPSVGPGNVLRDMIESNTLPVTKLTEIFRQAKGSKIITNAHKIHAGEFPDVRSESNSDFFFIRKEEPEEILQEILSLVSERLPKRYKYDPIEAIQVLSPMRRGIIGIDHLNQELQKKLNPQTEVVAYGPTRFGIGDKVMQIRNNYTKEVFNGDIGIIIKIDREEQTLTILFDKKEVAFLHEELDEIVLAYATSVHKFQGSEYPCVVIPIHTAHFMMLHRNLLYTAVTRGKRTVILVGTPKAIAIAVKNDEVKKRFTGLLAALSS